MPPGAMGASAARGRSAAAALAERERPRSRGRVAALGAAAALVIAAIAVAVVALSGGSKAGRPPSRTGAHTAPQTIPASRTTVTVLNGTETEGLAHRIAAELRFRGYGRAAALGGHPPGENQATVVQYASGDRASAEGVAHVMGINQIAPLNAEVAKLSNGAEVVVVIGANTAASTP